MSKFRFSIFFHNFALIWKGIGDCTTFLKEKSLCATIMEKPYTIEKAKTSLFEILIEFASFCEEHNLCYFLAYGTLLGAVRHQGFIPWDDDIDVMMPEKDYLKLKELYHSKRFSLHTCYDDPTILLPMGRMYDNNTYGIDGRRHTLGLSIDIYLMFGSPVTETEVDMHINNIRKFTNIGLGFKKWGNGLYHRYLLPERNFLLQMSKHYNMKRLEEYQKYPFEEGDYVFITTDSRRYKRSYFEGREKKMFEGREFYVPAGWHECLTVRYHDYMKLPPEEDRKIRHLSTMFYDKVPAYSEIEERGYVQLATSQG